MKTSNLLKWVVPALAAAFFSTNALADDTAAPAPAVASHMQKVSATIKAIDAPSRTLTLDGPNGLVNVEVGKEAKKFDQLKVGDKVVVSYYQGLAAQMKKGDGAKASEPVGAGFASGNKNGPGGIVGASVTSTVTIQAVDVPTHTVSFKRADGSVHVIEVHNAKMKKFIKTLKPGDVVEVTYTESIAIDVEPAA